MPLRTKIIYFSALLVIFAVAGYLAMQKYSADVPSDPNEYFPECNDISYIGVACLGDDEFEQKHPDAWGVAYTTHIELSQTVCNKLGIDPSQGLQEETSASYFTIDEWKNMTNCTNPSLDANGAAACCMIIHEIGHVCDSREDNPMCSERTTQETDQRCQNAVSEAKCDKNKSNYSESECKKSCEENQFRLVYKVYDNCMCEEYKNKQTITSESCCDCVKECAKSNKIADLLPDSCQQYYDKDMQKKDCLDTISGGHDCSYYGGPELENASVCASEGFPTSCLFDQLSAEEEERALSPICKYNYGDLYEPLALNYHFTECVPCSISESLNDQCKKSILGVDTPACGIGKCSTSKGGIDFTCVIKTSDNSEDDDTNDDTNITDPTNPADDNNDNQGDGTTTDPIGAETNPSDQPENNPTSGLNTSNNTSSSIENTFTPIDPELMYQQELANQELNQLALYQPAYWKEATNDFSVGISTTYNVVANTITDLWQGMFNPEPPQETNQPQDQPQAEPMWYQWDYWF